MKIYVFCCALFFTFCVGIRMYAPSYTGRELFEIIVFSGFGVAGWMFVIFSNSHA